MRLSFSIQKDVLKAKAGSILNTFKIFPRRDVLFFEEILAQYIRECEKAGFEKEMYEIGKNWCAFEASLIPPALKKLGFVRISNFVIKKVWKNLGLVDDFTVASTENKYSITTKDEFITRSIGENSFMRGGAAGAVSGFQKRDAICSKYAQGRGSCKYVVECLDVPFVVAAKKMEAYVLLNSASETKGFSLKNALTNGFFQLNDNKTTWRGQTLLYFENTGFHLIGQRRILLDCLSKVTASFFERLVKSEANASRKLLLLKSILESCGWGKVSVTVGRDGIGFFIMHPPYGLQAEADNWDFLAYFILGYLKLVNKKIVLKEATLQGGKLVIRYSGI